jgi:dTDP-4-dehydrorhamnose 3,5-epimerase
MRSLGRTETDMLFTETPLNGAFIVELEKRTDERGFFARSFCSKEFAELGLNPAAVQINVSFNHLKATLRGMHYQVEPATETKLIRCTRGAIYDVIVDMRPDSLTYLQHFGVELSETNHKALYVPAFFAHGYLTLTPDVETVYVVSEYYTPGCERGLRYDDPKLGIQWPMPAEVITEKDATWDLL